MINFNSTKGVGLELGILDGNIALLEWNQETLEENYCSQFFFHELHKELTALKKRENLKGLIFCSSNEQSFLNDYNWKEIASMGITPKAIPDFLNNAADCLALIEQLPFPTVVEINGFCRGCGFEFILAFDYRVACENLITTFKLPGITMGLPPSLGSPSRMSRICGLDVAIDVIANAASHSAGSLLNKGMLDEVVNVDRLRSNAINLINTLYKTGEWKSRRVAKAENLLISTEEIILLKQKFLEKSERKKTPDQKIILFAIGSCLKNAQDAQPDTIEFFNNAWKSNYVKNCFLMQNIKDSIWDLKQIGDADIPSSIDKVGVIGSGSIGPSIALLIAKRYIQSLLVDLVPVNLGQGTTAIIKELHDKLRQDVLSVEEMMQVQGRLNTSTVLSSLMDRNIIIEAIIENEEAKIELYNDLESFVSEDTIICSNTNSINLERLGSCLKNPGNFAGLHFYPPLLHPNLVLIVRTKATSDECVATLVAFAKKIKKTPIIINDSPGFLSNRLLLVWYRESQEMLIEGIDPYALDNAFRNAGFLFGLLEFMDLNGIDSCFYLNQSISEALVGDRFPVPTINKMLIEKGRLGVKSKVGYYKYNQENKSEPDPELIQMISPLQRAKLSLPDEEIVERLMLVAFIEANRIMSENVVPTPGMLDLALNLTINFPNEWGGPFKWAEIQGWEKIISLIQKYSYLGPRFVPDAYLAEKISQKTSYYS